MIIVRQEVIEVKELDNTMLFIEKSICVLLLINLLSSFANES